MTKAEINGYQLNSKTALQWVVDMAESMSIQV